MNLGKNFIFFAAENLRDCFLQGPAKKSIAIMIAPAFRERGVNEGTRTRNDRTGTGVRLMNEDERVASGRETRYPLHQTSSLHGPACAFFPPVLFGIAPLIIKSVSSHVF